MTVSAGATQFVLDLPQDFRIHTARLELVPANRQLVESGRRDRARLSELLGAHVPEQWPPELVEDYDAEGGGGWWDWYVLRRDMERPTLVGVVGLKGWPDVNGSLQFGCAFLPEFQDQRYGTESITAFAEWALSRPQINSVTADGPNGNARSIAILRRIGFTPTGPANEAGVVTFAKARQ